MRRMKIEMANRVVDGDIICHVFGPMSHIAGVTPKCFQVETGIGYTCSVGAMPYRIYESAAASDSVLLFEKELGESMQSDQRFAFEERNGRVVKQYASSYSALYHKKLNGMVERRMRSSIFSVASLWYTAWVEAGQPDLRKMGKLLSSPESLKNLDALQSAWLGGKIIGRSCTN